MRKGAAEKKIISAVPFQDLGVMLLFCKRDFSIGLGDV